jgi:L-fuculose-phosphate aldolase
MTEREQRELMCEIGRRTWQRGFVAATDGNFSCRLDERRILTTPTMMSKGFLEPRDLVVVDPDGNKVAGTRNVTSEIRLHLNCYRRRPDVRACVHAHPPHATAFAIVQDPVPKCVMPEAEVFLGEVEEFGTVLDPYLPDFNVFLLASHGALAIGNDLIDAYHRMETIDHYCRILINVRALGSPTPITPEAMDKLFAIKRRLGIPDRRLRESGDPSCATPSPAPPKSSDPSLSETEIEAVVDAVLEAIRARP